ncbi:MAG: HAD-IC family P-type ATPase, partial [archaeon]|nr:HAD-IC family P-type ATPase [archaeon]
FELLDEIQFSSERKFSAVRVRSGQEVHTIVMGAWSFLKPHVVSGGVPDALLGELSSRGLRSVVLFDAGDSPLHVGEEISLPDLRVLAVISIRDEVRPDCKELIGEFVNNGMDVKVISGDDPETVEALFKLAEIPGERRIISGDKLETMNEEEFSRAALETNIFGRMKPEQKEMVIDALRKNGRYVAMVGDGINDVRSIKKAQVGVAVQSGSGAARGVADMVLMNDDFKAIPRAIIEGKRTVSGMRDILRLYITRNFVIAMLVLVLLLILQRCPLLPIQNTAYALFTVSFASFLMTLWAKPSENKDLILPKVMRYVIPTSATLTIGALLVYALFYFGYEGHWFGGYFDLTSSYLSVSEKLGISIFDLAHKLSLGTGTGVAEINASNAMFTFLLMAGIAELLILFPLVKRLNLDEHVNRDVKPTLLAILLYGLMYLYYSIPEVCVNIGESLPVFEVWPLLIGFTVIWYVVTMVILKSSILQPLSDYVDRHVRKTLTKNFEKESRKELEE